MYAGTAFFAFAVFVCLFVTAGAAMSGDYSGIKYTLAFALFFATIPLYGWSAAPKSNGSLRVEDSDEGSIVRDAWQPFAALLAMTFSMGLPFAFGAYDSLPHPYRWDGLGGTVFFGVVALVFWSYPIAAAAGRLRPGSITFTSDGVRQRGWSYESFLPWESIAGSTAAYNGYPSTLIIGYANAQWERTYTVGRFWRIDRLPPVPLVEVDHRRMRDDAVLLHEFVIRAVGETSVG
ncbi:hypothetical protein OG921_03010 [Aldersonia sp. NBC_00410]|uniref:hypothetical protein n=1 Tax=Aldersonia sp. NBC_00410 TaxID=2975954 RepID=UPI0022577F33|nr:hypothetical protein [Aldersonia sp. NBC_00410]MCX5042161.1 hypothetical protein [Aldersonia sp. NBC_00410]